MRSWSNHRTPVPNFTAGGSLGAASQAVDSISRLKFLKACGAQAKMLWKPSPVENTNFMNHTCHHKASSVAPSEKICTEICPHTEDHQAHTPSPREDGELNDPCGIFLENSGKIQVEIWAGLKPEGQQDLLLFACEDVPQEGTLTGGNASFLSYLPSSFPALPICELGITIELTSWGSCEGDM